MKKQLLLALLLALACIELRAQVPSAGPIAPGRPPRYGITNATPQQPRYRPQTPAPGTAGPQAGAPGAFGRPGGAPGAGPGAPGVPGGVPSTPMSSSYSASSSFAASQEEMIAPGLIDFEGVDISQVLDIYAKLVNRTLLRAALPQSQIILKTQTPLTRTEAIEALQVVLALNGVSLVNIGEKFVKVIPSDQAGQAGQEIDRSGSTNIPAMGSYITHVVQLKYVKPTEMVPVIQPFSKLANSILAIDGNGILVLRDYAENVKRMLEMIEQVDVSVPAEYISEVIPIRYAKVDDIASALNALGGGGGATVSIGTAPSSGTISGFSGNRAGGGFGGMGSMGGVGGMGSSGGFGGGGMGTSLGGGGYSGGGFGGGGLGTRTGATTPNGTPSTGSTFQQRLQSIIGATGGGGGGGGQQNQIQLFGQTKIIPNESSSSLLIYATRADMDVIKGIIAKLDVPLAQVLVEAVIMDVTLGNTFNFGVSAAQNPAELTPGGHVLGGGGMVNSSSPFISFLKNVTTNYTSVFNGSNITQVVSGYGTSVTSSAGTNGSFGNALPSGFSYFGNIGPTWDVAVTAAESDNHANIIQRPRIQTSQAKPAQFFVGNTVPYVTGTYNGYSGYGGNSYSQLSVGVELDVTPFINPEGLVVMDIMQEIDDLNGYTAIQNVGNVPNTIKRTLNTEIAVRNRDTVMLGGFIKSDKSHTQSGVPFLSDIPILGNLFKQRQDSKDREELIVLMRPTVLDTPKMAAENTILEERRLPGVSEAASEDAAYERSLIEAQRKHEQKKFKDTGKNEGFFGPNETNSVPANPQSATEATPTQPEAAAEIINPLPTPVHPAANGGAPAEGSAPTEVNAPAAAAPAAPENNNPAPVDSATAQQKAAAALAEKMKELNSGSTNPEH